MICCESSSSGVAVSGEGVTGEVMLNDAMTVEELFVDFG